MANDSRLDIVTECIRDGEVVGSVSIKDLGKKVGFVVSVKEKPSIFNRNPYEGKKMTGALVAYDSLVDDFVGEGCILRHVSFEGYFWGCGYVSKYSLEERRSFKNKIA